MAANAMSIGALADDLSSTALPDRRLVLVYGASGDAEASVAAMLGKLDARRFAPCFAQTPDDVRNLLSDLSVILVVVDTRRLLAAQVQAIARIAGRHPRLRQYPTLFLFEPGNESVLTGSQRLCRSLFMSMSLPVELLQVNVATLIASIGLAEEFKTVRETLTETREQDRSEMDVAKRILDNILQGNRETPAHIRIHLQAMERLNGDMAVVQTTPAGKEQILVGDFSGHGLKAAVGGMIAADTFNAMTLKGYHIDEIAAQINRKLNRILPTGLYMAACLIEWDLVQGTMVIWNGGLPEVLLHHADKGTLERLRASHPPLGILPPEEFSSSVRRVPIEPGSRAYVYSDGLTETRNARHEMWGMAGLLGVLQGGQDPSATFDEILRRVNAFRGDAPFNDDVTMVELTFPDGGATIDRAEVTAPITSRLDLGMQTITTTTSLSLRLDARAIAASDPVPSVMQLMSTFNLSERNRSDVFVILRELVSNAIEHGLLDLDSSMKSTTDGFGEYYRLRDERLARLADGFVEIRIEREQDGDGSYDALRIHVEDSGRGFDHRKAMASTSEESLISEATSGRGVALLRTICREFRYNEAGNAVEVVYRLTRRSR